MKRWLIYLSLAGLLVGLWPAQAKADPAGGGVTSSGVVLTDAETGCNASYEARRSQKIVDTAIYSQTSLDDQKKNAVADQLEEDCYFGKSKAEKLQYIHANLASNQTLLLVAQSEGLSTTRSAPSDPARPPRIYPSQSLSATAALFRQAQLQRGLWQNYFAQIVSPAQRAEWGGYYSPQQMFLSKPMWRAAKLTDVFYTQLLPEFKANQKLPEFTKSERQRLTLVWQAASLDQMAANLAKVAPGGAQASGFLPPIPYVSEGSATGDILMLPVGAKIFDLAVVGPVKTLAKKLLPIAKPVAEKCETCLASAAGQAGRGAMRLLKLPAPSVSAKVSQGFVDNLAIDIGQLLEHSTLTRKQGEQIANDIGLALEQMFQNPNMKKSMIRNLLPEGNNIKRFAAQTRIVTVSALKNLGHVASDVTEEGCDMAGCYIRKSGAKDMGMVYINQRYLTFGRQVSSGETIRTLTHEYFHKWSWNDFARWLNEGATENLTEMVVSNASPSELIANGQKFTGSYTYEVRFLNYILDQQAKSPTVAGSYREVFENLLAGYKQQGTTASFVGTAKLDQRIRNLVEQDAVKAAQSQKGKVVAWSRENYNVAVNLYFHLDREVSVASGLKQVTSKLSKPGASIGSVVGSLEQSTSIDDQITAAMVRALERRAIKVNPQLAEEPLKAETEVKAQVQMISSQNPSDFNTYLDILFNTDVYHELQFYIYQGDPKGALNYLKQLTYKPDK